MLSFTSASAIHPGTDTRLAAEVLEARDCPTVTATLDGGVLRIVGDEFDNVIRVADVGRHVIVVGDGERHRFGGVEELVIESGKGDDRAVVVMDDGIEVFERGTFNLGTGGDTLRVTLDGVDAVDLNVLTADGGDEITIEILAPESRNVRPATTRMSLELGGPGNVVDVRTQNVDDVDFAIRVGADSRGDAVPGDHLTLDFDMAHAGERSARAPSTLSVETALADGDDRLDLAARGYAQVVTNLDLGAGRNTGKIRFLVRDGDLIAGTGSEPSLIVAYTRTGSIAAHPVSDSVEFISMGYDRITTEYNTGPAGGGEDRILALHIAEGSEALYDLLGSISLFGDGDSTGFAWLLRWLANSPLNQSIMVDRALLDDGRDEILQIAVGYDTWDIRTEQTRQVTVIQDL